MLELLLLPACSPELQTLTPADTLIAYVNFLAEGDFSSAMALRHSASDNIGVFKEVIGGALVLALMYVVINLTGLNPFSTMLSCMLIDKFVSPENRKLILVAVVGLVVLFTFYFYKLITFIPMRAIYEVDRQIVKEGAVVEILSSEIKGKKAEVKYRVLNPDGTQTVRKAKLVLVGGVWKIKSL